MMVYNVHLQFDAEGRDIMALVVRLAEALPGATWGTSSFQPPKYPTVNLVEAANDPIEAVATALKRVQNAFELLGAAYPPSVTINVAEEGTNPEG